MFLMISSGDLGDEVSRSVDGVDGVDGGGEESEETWRGVDGVDGVDGGGEESEEDGEIIALSVVTTEVW